MPSYPLLVFGLFTLSLSLFFGFRGRRTKNMHLTVKWNSERFTIPYPEPDTPLAMLRKQVAECTRLPFDAFKLVHSGAVMKDDSAPVSAYKLKPSSKIVVIGVAPSEPKQKAQPRTEQSIISQIHSELADVRSNLVPSLDAYLASTRPATGEDKERLRLSELLLQSLLRLDSITAESEWQEARKERKGAVKEVQALLDRLDGRDATR